jgi:prepilin signal peptidase PulO-like enzyme (type II secretory pathway)
LPGVQALLVVGTSVAGVVVGLALDPLGQRMADASKAADERRRAEAAADRDDAVAEPDLPAVPVEASHLLPAGRSIARQVGSALTTGILFGAHLVFFALLAVVSITDLSHRLVPRGLIYGALALVVPLLVATSAVDHNWRGLAGSAIAGTASFGLFFAIWSIVPRGMGYGDVRLAGAIGLTVGYLSLLHAYVAFLVGFLVGALAGGVLILASSAGRKTKIPFAPSLAAGAVIAVLWGGTLARHVFHAGA